MPSFNTQADNGVLCHSLGGPVILFSLQHFIAPALDYCLYGEESGTLSPQVKKWHSAFRATFSIKICTYSCMHVQYKQHMQASPIKKPYKFCLKVILFF